MPGPERFDEAFRQALLDPDLPKLTGHHREIVVSMHIDRAAGLFVLASREHRLVVAVGALGEPLGRAGVLGEHPAHHRRLGGGKTPGQQVRRSREEGPRGALRAAGSTKW